MKGALIALSIGITLLVFLFLNIKIYRSNGKIDILLHDTTFIVSYVFVIMFVLLFSGTFFAVGGIIGTFFKSKIFWILAVLFLSFDTYYILTFHKAFHNTKITRLPKE